MSSNDFNGPYRPAGERGADDDSSGARRPGNGRGGQGAQGGSWSGGGYARGGRNGSAAGGHAPAGAYPPPEGWDADGIWRDSGIDANYQTGALGPAGAHFRGQAGNGRHVGGRGQAGGQADGHGPGNGPGNGATAFYGGPGQRGPFGNEATRVQQAPGGYRDAIGRFTGPIAGSITDSWRRIGDRMGSGWRGGPGGPGSPGGPGGPRGPRGPRPGIGPGGRRVRREGDWWRHWTWRKALGVVGAMVGLFILIIVFGVMYLYNSTSIPTQELAANTFQNSTVYFSDGKTPIGTYGDIHRQILTYNQIPQLLDDAVMAIEDRSFMTEGGISPTGIMRAAWDDLTGNSSSLAGGSTITQEFVRQYYAGIGTQQTASRKIKEIFVAMKISKDKSKEWILTNYLNTIYLGQGAYGVAAAAQTYFNEPVSKLTAAQAAVIAAIIQQPTNYPLPQYRPQLISRWHNVLNGMVQMGVITQETVATMKFPVMSDAPTQGAGPEVWDPYIMAEIKGELEQVDHYTEQQLDTGGLKVVTTISQYDEKHLYKAVNYNISQIRAQGFRLPSYAMIGAEEQNPANGAILAIYGGPGMNLSPKKCAGTCQLNATLQTEQVGSSFKPYVISAAVQEGMNVQTSMLNANGKLWVPPFSMGSTLSSTKPMPAGEGYFPVHNDTNTTIPGAQRNGGSTVQNALAQSSNTAFTDLAHRVGLKQIEQMAESEGGVDPAAFAREYGVGIALGIDSLSINDQATMVSTIDDNGVYHAAHMVASVTPPGGTTAHPPAPSHVALNPALDSQVQYSMLKTVVDGTATAAAMNDGRPIIGKTGTTTSSKSAFFVGGIPQYALAVGIYVVKPTDPNQSLTALGGGGFGGVWPAAIWHTFAEDMWSNLPVQSFLNPQFSGQAWIQVPKTVPPKKKHDGGGNQNGNGGLPFPLQGKHHHPFPTPSIFPTTPSGTSTALPPTGQPTSPSVSPSSSTQPALQGVAASNAGVTQATSSVREAGLALGGALSVLPGSLLWVRISRRRNRRRHSGAAG